MPCTTAPELVGSPTCVGVYDVHADPVVPVKKLIRVGDVEFDPAAIHSCGVCVFVRMLVFVAVRVLTTIDDVRN
jgi:hypothetical protein